MLKKVIKFIVSPLVLFAIAFLGYEGNNNEKQQDKNISDNY
tara:strand:- start:296 stop:418 length:123 start_codon:yes stop_codon:yes gene_type:complete